MPRYTLIDLLPDSLKKIISEIIVVNVSMLEIAAAVP